MNYCKVIIIFIISIFIIFITLFNCKKSKFGPIKDSCSLAKVSIDKNRAYIVAIMTTLLFAPDDYFNSLSLTKPNNWKLNNNAALGKDFADICNNTDGMIDFLFKGAWANDKHPAFVNTTWANVESFKADIKNKKFTNPIVLAMQGLCNVPLLKMLYTYYYLVKHNKKDVLQNWPMLARCQKLYDSGFKITNSKTIIYIFASICFYPFNIKGFNDSGKEIPWSIIRVRRVTFFVN